MRLHGKKFDLSVVDLAKDPQSQHYPKTKKGSGTSLSLSFLYVPGQADQPPDSEPDDEPPDPAPASPSRGVGVVSRYI